MTRRTVLASSSLALAQTPITKVPPLPQAKIDNLDKAVDTYIAKQILDKSHKYYGAFPGEDGLFYGGTPISLIDGFLTAYLHPQSRHHNSARVA